MWTLCTLHKSFTTAASPALPEKENFFFFQKAIISIKLGDDSFFRKALFFLP
jgi:hypothetical protein